ncbi:MAG: hypothetical protein HQL73_07370, partial [Magnetococcales bacterium]|nr:hypothetical protein [Magnetococcales bacterium]
MSIEFQYDRESVLRNRPRMALICPMAKERAMMSWFLGDPENWNNFVLGNITTDKGYSHCVVLKMVGKYNVDAGQEVHELLEVFPNVESVILVGIGGGLGPVEQSSQVFLGDVVISDNNGIFCLDHMSEGAGGPRRLDHTISISRDLLNVARGLQGNPFQGRLPSWQVAMQQVAFKLDLRQPNWGLDPYRSLSPPPRWPDSTGLHFGGIGSSNTVFRCAEKRETLKKAFHTKNFLALDMESEGVANVCQKNNKKCLVVRGITDYCDENKEDGWHDHAMIAAGAVAAAIVGRLPVESDSAGMGCPPSRTPLPVRPLPRIPNQGYFIGRKMELAKIVDVLSRERIFNIHGVTGIGKSVLAGQAIQEFLAAREPAGHVTAASPCYVVNISSGDTVENIRRIILDQVPVFLNPTNDHQATDFLLEACLQKTPVVLFDGCGGLAAEELQALLDLARRMIQSDAVCLFTSYQAFGRPWISDFKLDEFSTEEATAMVRDRLSAKTRQGLDCQRGWDQGIIQEFCHVCGNHPLTMELSLAQARTCGMALTIARDTVHPREADSVNSALERVDSGNCKKIMLVAGLFPHSFTLNLLSRVMVGFDPSQLKRCFHALYNNGFFYPAEDNSGLMEQDSLRYAMLPPLRRYALKQGAQEDGNVYLKTLISYFEQVGREADLWDVAIEPPPSITEMRERRFTFILELENIVSFIGQLLYDVSSPPQETAHLITACADGITRSGRRDILYKFIQKALSRFQNIDPSTRGRLHAHLAAIFHRWQQLREMESELEKAIALLGRTSDWRYLGYCYLWQGWLWIEDDSREPDETKRRAKAMAGYRQAEKLGQFVDDPILKIYAMQHIGHELMWREQHRLPPAEGDGSLGVRGAAEIYDQVIAQSKRFGLWERMCRALSAKGKYAANRGDTVRAIELAKESRAIADAIQDPRSGA